MDVAEWAADFSYQYKVRTNMPVSTKVRLLAKSPRPGKLITLQDHSIDTARVGDLIFNLRTRVGRNYCKAFGFNDYETTLFSLNLKVACLLHDIGKANEGFMRAVSGERYSQVIRHEHLSAMILYLPVIREWLEQNPDIKFEPVLSAVLSHHLKAERTSIGLEPLDCRRSNCNLFLQDNQVVRILAEVSRIAGLGPAPDLPNGSFGKDIEPWKTAIGRIKSDGRAFRRSLANKSPEMQLLCKLVAAIKSALIVSDSVASGLVRAGLSIEDWIYKNIHVERLTASALQENVIQPRIDSISRRQKAAFTVHEFQRAVAELGPKCLLLAGCGTGKTLAGYLWAKKQLEEGDYGRVIFLYPTRGTATEGFNDYTAWAPEDQALLMHGSARYALEALYENPSEAAEGKNFLSSDEESRVKLYSLSNYGRRFYSATIDQFLSFLQHNYSGLCMTPILTDSVLVIDEIHSFDRALFNTLLEFINRLRIPVLCMTVLFAE